MQAQLELGDDAKAAGASSQGPEQIRMLAGSRAHAASVGQHDVGTDQIVAGETVSTHEPAGAAAERETADTGRRNQAARRRETGGRGGGIDVAPACAAFDRRDTQLSIDADRAHSTQVQQQGFILHGEPGDVVATAAHRDFNAVIARNLQRELNIARVGAAGNGARSTIDGRVPDSSQAVEFTRRRRRRPCPATALAGPA